MTSRVCQATILFAVRNKAGLQPIVRSSRPIEIRPCCILLDACKASRGIVALTFCCSTEAPRKDCENNYLQCVFSRFDLTSVDSKYSNVRSKIL